MEPESISDNPVTEDAKRAYFDSILSPWDRFLPPVCNGISIGLFLLAIADITGLSGDLITEQSDVVVLLLSTVFTLMAWLQRLSNRLAICEEAVSVLLEGELQKGALPDGSESSDR